MEKDCWAVAYGYITTGDKERAIAHCEKEPCSRHVDCQRFLGWTYYERDDQEKALNWFSLAAAQGDSDALFGIGSAHFARHEFKAALESFERALAAGNIRACHWIAYIHHQGLAVPRNLPLAIQYYERGAAAGYLIAQRALVHITWQGGGFWKRIGIAPAFLWMIIKSAVIALRDITDPRIADVPNAFATKSRQKSSA